MILPSDRKGLTLFEVMVAMIIMVTVTVMMYEALSAGISFFDRGEARMQELERHTAIFDLLHRQVHSAMYDSARKRPWLKVENDTLRLVTHSPLIAAYGPVFALYRIDSGRLYYLEKRDYYNKEYRDDEPSFSEMTVLMDDAGDLTFAESDDTGGVTISAAGRSYTVYPRCLRPENLK